MANQIMTLPEQLIREAETLSLQQGIQAKEVLEQALAEGLERMKERHVLGLYRNRKVSLQRAAEMLGLDLWTMIDRIGEADIHLDYEVEELSEDLRS